MDHDVNKNEIFTGLLAVDGFDGLEAKHFEIVPANNDIRSEIYTPRIQATRQKPCVQCIGGLSSTPSIQFEWNRLGMCCVLTLLQLKYMNKLK
ncbi:hypothetical protein TNIN_272381 [Trichonephila inaurata madagascariensis]|uniref:Uncharacterized protein n=1 Tax=Trichonephila inaurata madagascariensis TaxID=2747483 RepID=A0A8X6X3H0_9ARAC|nr:hypothetical protein TNIN_272381 [Trichonephila inaurata madagascariensis]